jgi:putative aminopeptidase FrvX
MDFASLLSELTAISGISGHERDIADFMAGQLRRYASSVAIDPIYNVIAKFGAGERKVAICAHIDTIGLMVKQRNKHGSLDVVRVGGVNYKALPGTVVRVGEHHGMVGVRSQHQARAGDDAIKSDADIYVDVGNISEIEITTPITYAPQEILLDGGFYCAPYLDNRAGCAVLLALAKALAENPPNCSVYLIGSVQEETTCLGAYAALQAVSPHEAIFVDGTVSYDTPETAGRGSVMLGAGGVLTAYLYVSGLNGWHAHPKIRERLKLVAQAEKLPYQQDATHGLMSDARVAPQLGIPSAIVGIPMRGKHSPLETIHLHDLDTITQVLGAYVRGHYD